MRALCYKCNYGWNYKGKQRGKDHLSCPRCSYRLVADRVVMEDLHKQETLLHDFPMKLHKKPLKLHTYIHDFFKRVVLNDGTSVLVEKNIAKQFEEAPEDLDEEIECVIEQEDTPIKILSPRLPSKIQEAFDMKKLEQDNPFLNLQIEKPNFEVRLIPRDPVKILEHQMSFH